MEPLIAEYLSFALRIKQGAVSSGEYLLTLSCPSLVAEAATATHFGAGTEDKRALGSEKRSVLPSDVLKWWEHSFMMRTDVGSNPVPLR